MISFAEAHPELVPEWAESNGDLLPEGISYGSNKKIKWVGKCGHEWEAVVKNRSNGSGCPFCSGNQVLYGFNDLASACQELASEWSELNQMWVHSPPLGAQGNFNKIEKHDTM